MPILQGKKMEYRKNSRGWETVGHPVPDIQSHQDIVHSKYDHERSTSNLPSLFNVKSRLQIDEHGLLDRAHGDL